MREGMKKQWQSCVRKSPYRGDVTALCLISSPQRHLLLAGTGAQVLLYDLITGGLLCSRNVFDGVRVHGLYSGPAFGKEDTLASHVAFRMGTIVIHGERKIKLFKMVWNLEDETPQLRSLGSLPRFSYWVMDVRILQEEGTTSKSTLAADTEDFHLLAVGLSNNTICIWDLLNSAMIYHVECSERCLLYSMRLWGDSLDTLHAGAGTVFNEILVMKLGSNLSAVRKISKDLTDLRNSDNSKEHQRRELIAQHPIVESSRELVALEEMVHPLQRLIGHEGSIHRLTWSSDGLSLVSVSDDRSARVWCAKKSAAGGSPWLEGIVPGPVLYGHGSRLWDCYVGEKLLITASEDCTCRVWTAEGQYLATLKGHIGRGIWRCVYDAEVNILVTAGADSSIKVQLLDKWVPRASSCETDQRNDPSVQKLELQSFSISPPWFNGSSEGSSGFMDSKSEYVRCVALSSPWSLYVCTNQGAVYHVHLQSSKEASWTLLLDDVEGPIVCMDVLVQGLSRDGFSGGVDFSRVDVVAVGNGEGIVCVMQVRRTAGQWHCEWRHSWVAEKERQLLGVYFCKSLGRRYVFTTDPRGTWRMWLVSDRAGLFAKSVENPSVTSCTDLASCGIEEDAEKYTADMIAYGRGYQARVLCIDVCTDLELLVCGDKQGDLTAYSLPKHLCQWVSDDIKLARNTEIEAPTQLTVVTVFKGAHGISAIASVSIMPFNPGRQPEIISTGSDGCICRFVLDQLWTGAVKQTSQHLLCTGIEKVAELAIVECLQYCKGLSAQKRVDRRIVAGFTGSDFLLWDLSHQCEVMRVICGGWRRPHSVFIGDLPEMQYCFAFIKDKLVQVQRNWVNSTGGEVSIVSGSSLANAAPKMTTQSLRGQFHGKEISSVLFLCSAIQSLAHEGSNLSTWIATGSEDGTVVISRYAEDADEQLDPAALLGDHVGGSAVRALALVAEVDLVRSDEVVETIADSAEWKAPLCGKSSGRTGDQELLFSAGAKEVLTCWLLDWLPEVEGDELSLDHCQSVEKLSTSSAFPRHRAPSSQWLSTHSPERVHPFVEKMATRENETVSAAETDEQVTRRVDKKQESYPSRPDDADDDQRYLALTAFGTRCTKKRTLISFIATASSNATLHLYAFHLAHRSWSELAVLENDATLVLTVEHLVAPFSSYDSSGRDVYLILTGASNGNIALWDVTSLVHDYCSSADLDVNRAFVAALRPVTGRGSQGGRRRKKTGEQSRESVNLKYSEGKFAGMEKAPYSDPVSPALVSRCGNAIPDEECAGSNYIQATLMVEENGLSEPLSVQPSKEPGVKKPPLRLNPDQELIAAHQSGINCMAVGRIQRGENSASSKMVYVVISGGDDQALHMATFALEVNNSNDSGSTEGGKVESSFASMPLVLQCLSRSSVPCAHNSSVKGLWTDGFWAFSTGLDQRLRCWRIDVDVEFFKPSDSCEGYDSRHPKASSPLVECLTCVIDVPEPASLHVKLCPGGLYQIAVVGRGLQVINFDSNSLSC